MKNCPVCDFSLPLSEFARNAKAKDGLQTYCRACAAKKLAAWQSKNRERVRELGRAYSAAHRDEINRRQRQRAKTIKDRERVRKWCNENPERSRAIKRAHYERNRDALLAKQKAYYEANKSLIRAWAKEFKKANPAKLRMYQARQREKLNDCYIRKLMKQSMNLRPSDIPAFMVQIKRDEIALRRLARLLTEGVNDEDGKHSS